MDQQSNGKEEQAINSLRRIKNRLLQQKDDNSDLVAPSYHEVLMDERHWTDIEFVYKILEKYRGGDFDRFMPEIESDLIKLSAGILRISTLVGYMKGNTQHADGIRRVLCSKYHIQIKEIAEDMNIRLTESAAESMSRVAAKEQYQYHGEVAISHEMLSSLYFSAMAFVRVLEGVAQRLQHEKFGKY
jgi:hypothetical protein